MRGDDLLSGIQVGGRLHGRNETVRVVRAVLGTLGRVVDTAPLEDRVPADLLPAAAPDDEAWNARRFIHTVAALLMIDEPDAAFLCRVTFTQLNAACESAPAMLAPLAPADLRPLLLAHPDQPVLTRLVPEPDEFGALLKA
jgi:hypothetical protein